MIYRWIKHEGSRLYDVGVRPDGSLHNPNGYPDRVVRAAVAAAREREHQRRSEAAIQAAATRRRRTGKRVYQVARRIADGELCGPRSNCIICGRGLGDERSIQRGIGSECWQDVLDSIDRLGIKITMKSASEQPASDQPAAASIRTMSATSRTR